MASFWFSDPGSKDLAGLRASLVLHLVLAAGVWGLGYWEGKKPRSLSPEVLVVDLGAGGGEGAAVAEYRYSQPSVEKQAIAPHKEIPVTNQKKTADHLRVSQSAPAEATESDVSSETVSNQAPPDESESSTESFAEAQGDSPRGGGGGGGGGSKALSARERYLAEVLRAIEANKFYPPEARMRHQTGTVEITFSILKDGTITQIELTQPAQFASLNRAGVGILQRIGQFRPLPPELGEPVVRLTVPIEYGLR